MITAPLPAPTAAAAVDSSATFRKHTHSYVIPALSLPHSLFLSYIAPVSTLTTHGRSQFLYTNTCFHECECSGFHLAPRCPLFTMYVNNCCSSFLAYVWSWELPSLHLEINLRQVYYQHCASTYYWSLHYGRFECRFSLHFCTADDGMPFLNRLIQTFNLFNIFDLQYLYSLLRVYNLPFLCENLESFT